MSGHRLPRAGGRGAALGRGRSAGPVAAARRGGGAVRGRPRRPHARADARGVRPRGQRGDAGGFGSAGFLRGILREAARLDAEPHAVVLGPAVDGGYYLVGATQLPDIFTGIAWGGPDVLPQTEAAAAGRVWRAAMWRCRPMSTAGRPGAGAGAAHRAHGWSRPAPRASVSSATSVRPRPLPPAPAILRPLNRLEVQLVLGGLASRAASDDHDITWLERVLGDVVAVEAGRVGPLGGIRVHPPRRVGRVHVQPGVGRAVVELHHVALDGHRLLLVVIGGERVVRRQAGPDDGCAQQPQQDSTHHAPPPATKVRLIDNPVNNAPMRPGWAWGPAGLRGRRCGDGFR